MLELSWEPSRLVRPAHAGDAEGVHDLLARAFGREDEAVLVERLRETPAHVPALTLVADIHCEVVGFVMLTAAHVATEQGDVLVLALAPLAVDPDYQGRGIGSALASAAHDRARILGYPAVFVLGHPAYYARFGYRPASQFGVRSPFDAPDEAFMALELQPGALEGASGVLRFADPFDGLA